MKDICHLLYCPFTGLGLHNGYRGDGWLRNRIKIFKEYPLKSLLAQTEKDFVLWISWRPQEKTNPQVIELYEYLKDKLNVVFTYHGICFWDDKYPNDRLITRLEETLPELKDVVGDRKYVYMTIQPSDDTYWTSMVEEAQIQPFRYKGAYGYNFGYILNMKTLEMAEYNPTIYPPFYTIMFPAVEFLSPYQHFTYIGPYVDHGKIPSMFETVNSPIRGFIVGIHGENISTVWNEPFRGKLLTSAERDEKLKHFNLTNIKPIVLKPHFWLIGKTVYNKLPKPFKRISRSIVYLIVYKLIQR